MILYVNGDSHSAGAEAVNDWAFANADPQYHIMGRRPHPKNLMASYGRLLADSMDASLYCDAESASSNDRIIRTTREYLDRYTPDAVVIGWTTWEREEWLVEGEYLQVNSVEISATGNYPSLADRYKEWVIDIDWQKSALDAHAKIFAFHKELSARNIPHLFFNCYSDFSPWFYSGSKFDWGNSYIDPYDPKMTYWQWLTDRGYKSTEWYHFKADGHKAWAEFLLPHLTKIINESIITT